LYPKQRLQAAEAGFDHSLIGDQNSCTGMNNPVSINGPNINIPTDIMDRLLLNRNRQK